jgi:hypothetical protein
MEECTPMNEADDDTTTAYGDEIAALEADLESARADVARARRALAAGGSPAPAPPSTPKPDPEPTFDPTRSVFENLNAHYASKAGRKR